MVFTVFDYILNYKELLYIYIICMYAFQLENASHNVISQLSIGFAVLSANLCMLCFTKSISQIIVHNIQCYNVLNFDLYVLLIVHRCAET